LKPRNRSYYGLGKLGRFRKKFLHGQRGRT
jgi:hypothetical protein